MLEDLHVDATRPQGSPPIIPPKGGMGYVGTRVNCGFGRKFIYQLSPPWGDEVFRKLRQLRVW